MTSLRLRTRVNFPATVSGEGGIDVRKESGEWIIFPDFSALTSIPASSVSDPSLQQIWIWDEINDTYAVLTLAGLGDALFKLTSTTSNSIGTGSKVFTVQANKDVGVGQYVIITDDAAPSTNYMIGQITDYTTTSLTVNVTTTGGSGTKTAWTIRVGGATGATGATGAAGTGAGIKQTYSTTTADADPGAGTFRLNNATPASATAAYLDNVDSGGSTVSGIFDLWDDSGSTVRGFVRFEKTTDPTIWAQFQVTGSVVDGTGYRKLTLANGAGSGAFTNADVFAITFYRTGDPGTIGGSTGATDNRLLRADGTGGATVQSSAVSVDDTGNMTPSANDAAAIGAAATSWSDLFLASGAVINYANGNYTLTHTSGELVTSGPVAIGNADTSVSRASAGVIAVEGVNLTANIPITSKSAAYTIVLADANTCIYHPSSDNNARTFTIDSNANVAYPVGTTLNFVNEINTVTIAITSDTLTLAGSGSTGSRTLAASGTATALKVASTKWIISGVGLT